jgi:hypothetical protein
MLNTNQKNFQNLKNRPQKIKKKKKKKKKKNLSQNPRTGRNWGGGVFERGYDNEWRKVALGEESV